MKIEKNETALGWMGKLKIEIIESGHAYLDHAWRYQNACAPFSRLYFVKDGEGILEIGEKQMVLEPGYAYLIPAGLQYDYHCESYMEKWYFHINIRMPDGFDLFDGCRMCYSEKLSEEGIQRLEQQYDAVSLDAVFGIQAEVMKAVGDVIHAAGLEKREVRTYSPLLQEVFVYVRKNISSGLNVSQLAEYLNISPSTLAKRFKKETEMTIGSYLDQILFNQACQLLLTTDLSVGQISEQLGFCDQFYFSRYFKRHQNETPTNYRSRMKSLRTDSSGGSDMKTPPGDFLRADACEKRE